MGLFSGIDGADPNNSGVYIIPGIFDVEILELKTINSRKGDALFIVETNILASSSEERPVGTKMSWVVNFRHDPALGNVKAFIAACGDCDFDDVDEEAAEMAVSTEQPFKGTVVKARATNTTTKAGNPFTVVDWKHEADTVEEYQAAQAA